MEANRNAVTPQQWLTTKEAAQHIAVSPSFIRKAIYTGKLKASDISLGDVRSEWRISVDDLDAFISAAP